MIVLLAWRFKNAATHDPEAVAARLARRFAPLFDEPPVERRRAVDPQIGLAWLDIPAAGWSGPVEDEDEERWVLAIEPAVNLTPVMRKAGLGDARAPLLALAGQLQEEPRRVLRHLAPPTAYLWHDRRSNDLRVQTDGLGHAQLYEYEDDRVYAITNRVQALTALGVTLTPVVEEWATRFTLGWFPLSCTGFRGVETLDPGTQIRLHADGIARRTTDVLTEWVHPDPMRREDALELGRESLVEYLSAAAAQWQRPSVGLSGGWDSRAVVAILRHLRADVDLRVRGAPHRIDVMIANELARVAGLELRTKTHGGLPPSDVEEVRASIQRGLLWQSGAMHLKKHVSFQARCRFKRRAVVNVMGSHAGIGKADFAVKIGAHELSSDQFEEALIDKLLRDRPRCLRAELHDPVRDRIVAAYRHGADRYGLSGLHQLHFLFLHEYTRRWAAGAINAAVDLVCTPYLNPDFIRACYAMPPEDIPSKPFHRHVTPRYAPDWTDIPYESDVTEDDVKSGRFRPVTDLSRAQPAVSDKAERWRPAGHHRKFNYHFFWKDIGKPLIREARYAFGSFCQEVFDKDTIRANYKQSPDAIAVAALLPDVL